ncbi:hypothetical protein Poly30_50380 [Planctomycetes bacterium Poly30]|uniref:Uncharacterized protein n=1 Tax=Saltatorellus ferox TaxID=2528018 RepID=A0A518EZG0_9BACT|nr:hypothetical protein Poly30_50380 [Planctomycetes bacterium Poly30]
MRITRFLPPWLPWLHQTSDLGFVTWVAAIAFTAGCCIAALISESAALIAFAAIQTALLLLGVIASRKHVEVEPEPRGLILP